MQISAELRWFWDGEVPADVRRWFDEGGCRPGGGEVRHDRYFHERGNRELGIKIRDEGRPSGSVEIKGLLADLPAAGLPLAASSVQLWCKWKSAIVPDQPGVLTEKRRWLRKFDAKDEVREIALGPDEKPLGTAGLPAVGCNIELTQVAFEHGPAWWTLGFEAFGGLQEAPAALRAIVHAIRPPQPGGGTELSYPAWIDARIG